MNNLCRSQQTMNQNKPWKRGSHVKSAVWVLSLPSLWLVDDESRAVRPAAAHQKGAGWKWHMSRKWMLSAFVSFFSCWIHQAAVVVVEGSALILQHKPKRAFLFPQNRGDEQHSADRTRRWHPAAARQNGGEGETGGKYGTWRWTGIYCDIHIYKQITRSYLSS